METKKLTCQLIINDHLPKHISDALGLEKPVYTGKTNQIYESECMDSVINKLETSLCRVRDEDFFLRLSIVENINTGNGIDLYVEPESNLFKKGTYKQDSGLLYIVGRKIRQVTMEQTAKGMISCVITDYAIDYNSSTGYTATEILNVTKFGYTENFLSDDLVGMADVIRQGRGRLLKKIHENQPKQEAQGESCPIEMDDAEDTEAPVKKKKKAKVAC